MFVRKKFLFHVLLSFSLSFTLVGCTSWPSLFIVMFGGNGKSGGLLLIPPGGDDTPADTNTATSTSTATSGTTGTNTARNTATSTSTSTSTDTATTTDPTTPAVTGISTTAASGYYKAGNTIVVTVQFDQSVTVSGIPELALNNDVSVDYTSGSGTDTLVFSYVVQVTDDVLGLDTKSSSALSLQGGSIQGTNGSLDADLLLPSPGDTGSLGSAATINIDTIQPAKDPSVAVTSSSADATYGAGANIDVSIKFTEAVFVDTSTGTPRLALNTTPTMGYATYLSGSGTDTLIFRYIPAAGENSSDLDYGSTAALELNGGTILDIAQNNAILSLPSPGGSGSLANLKEIVVNTYIPSISVDSPVLIENGTNISFQVSLSGASADTVTVDYTTSDVTALAGADYTSTSGTLSFAAGETTKTIVVPIADDTLDENDETFSLLLSNANAAATIGTSPGFATILDNDTTPSLSIAGAGLAEGNSGSTNMSFTVSLSAASGRIVSVSYATSNGTANAGADYTALAGTLSFAVGETSKTVNVAILGDALDESNETFTVALSSPNNASLLASVGTGTIADDDATPSLAIDSPTVAENVAGNTLQYVVTLSAASGQAVSVSYASSNGTASAGADYSAVSGTLNFAPGETSKTIGVALSNDALDEDDETVLLTLASPVNASLATATGTGTISDDDATPSLTIDSPSVAENVASANLTYTVTLSAASGKAVTVDYASSDNSALAGTDYTSTTGTLTFAAGETSKTIDVPLTNDALDEVDETLTMTLTSPSNATISTATGTGTITDEDAEPSLSINDVTLSEGNSGTKTFDFTVTLSAVSSKTITVNYATANNTATSGSDYTAIASTGLTFNPGDMSKTLSVTVSGDEVDEGSESFYVNLSGASNASIADSQGLATITNDDTAGVSISSVTGSTNEAGSSAKASYTVVLNTQPTGNVVVNVSSDSQNTVDRSVLTFTTANWNTAQVITVTAVDDRVDEVSPHTGSISHSIAAGSTADTTYAAITGIASASVGVVDNDTSGVTISSVTGSTDEGNSSTKATYTVVLNSEPTGNVVLVVTPDTQNTVALSTLTFTAANWSTAQTVTVTAVDDSLDEIATHTGSISHAINIGATADSNYDAVTGIHPSSISIADNDTAGVSISSVSGSTDEGNSATKATYTVVLDSEPIGNVVLSVTPDPQNTVVSSSLTFTPANWDTAQTVTVTAVDDDLDEAASHTGSIGHFIDTVATVDSNYDAVTGIASVSIGVSDNDAAGVTITQSGGFTDVTEGGTTDTYTVVLDSKPSASVTIGFSTGADVSSIADISFTTGNWDTAQTVTVVAIDDAVYEGSQTSTISHSASSGDSAYNGVSMGDVTVSVSDNETAPNITIDNAVVTEGNSGTNTAIFTVTLSVATEAGVTVDYATADNTATTADSDYTGISTTTLNIAALATSNTLTVVVNGDAKDEVDESYYVNLSNASVGTITDSQGKGTITNDDSPPTVQFASASSSSGDETATNRTVTLNLSATSSKTITVQVTDAGSGSATSGTDYTAIGSPVTVTFNAGSTSETVTIPVLQDLLFEGDETIALTLGSPSNASLGSQTSYTFTITDDEIGITSAETMDADNDGKIDHYKLTFSEAINDSTFPGYSLNAVGSSQSKWLVSGYSGVVLAHGSASPESDTANDNVIYLQFTEGSSSDTAAKPDLTTTSAPDLTAVSGKSVGQLFTASVTEADKAKPVIVSASGQNISSTLSVIFSEPVYGTTGALACGTGGALGTATVTYADVSASDVAAINSMGSDACATDATAAYLVDTDFTTSDNGIDTVAASVNLYDAANNTGNTRPIAIAVTFGPSISRIEQYDTDVDGKIDQLQVTFSVSIQDSSIADTDAAQFTMGGTALTKVDGVAGGTGTIASPNNDSGTANDTVVTVFSDDFTISGTDKKAMAFTTASGKWLGSGIEVQTVADLSSVVVDKAPPVILTAVAAENATAGAGIDSDDTLVLTFSEATNKPTINDGNISSIFSLSSSHTWGTIASAIWNTTGDELTITFAGSGSPTITVGDYITILGTIADTATTPNIATNLQSVSPITGTFEVPVPVVTNASSMDASTVRVTFSRPVNNSDATTVANYKIADSISASGLCADNSNFTASTSSLSISSVTKIDDYTYDLTTALQADSNSYVLLVDKDNVHHRDYLTYTISCPNNANFLGQERLKVSSATCNSLLTVVATFSKPVKTGVNVTNSAECDSTTECAKRYTIRGAVSGTEVGNITSARVLDGTVCGGLPANSNKVCVTHNLNQNGSIYTLLAANNTDGDGFDDSSFGAIQDSSGIETLLASPKDRAAFQGCGTVPQNFVDGAVISDPFGDGTPFGYLEKYNSKLYIGPNKGGNGATRFNADGSSPENLTFEILKDTTGKRKSDSSASAPFNSIGSSGCSKNNSSSAGCGPNNENGRGNFTVGTFAGNEYLFISGAKDRDNDYLYFTTDTDSVLNFDYLDASWGFDNYDGCRSSWNSSVVWNSVSESIHIFNGNIYWSVPGAGTNRPFLTKITSLNNEMQCGPDGAYMNMRYMIGVGRHAVGGDRAQPDNLGGLFNSFQDRVYFMNSGSISYKNNSCEEGDTYSAGVCEQTGGIVRSTNDDPANCTSAGCTDWIDITPSSTEYRKYFTIGLEKLTDLIPANKPIPDSAEHQGNFFFIRNACTEVLWDDGCLNGNCSDDMLCPAGSEIPQLWKCDPSATGDLTECDSDDWSLVAQNGSTGKTNFGDGNNTKITMVAQNGDYLYVGFDNPTTGIEVWRTNTADPSVEGDFSQIGGDGFGEGTDVTEIYDRVSLGSGSIHYLYMSIGKSGVPVRVHRQQNTGPVVSLEIEDIFDADTLLAYASNSTGIPREYFYLFLSLFLITTAILFYRLRKRIWKRLLKKKI
ncbi:MAG: Calx-beta domain-containing protein [Spirochaetota bacterium]